MCGVMAWHRSVLLKLAPALHMLVVAKKPDTDMEIIEEGDKGETSGPVPTVVKGQLDLTLETYRIGRSCVNDAELDKYVKRGLLKALLHRLCYAPG